MKYIDAHVHVWTDDLAHYPLGTGWTKADMKPARFTPEDLFKHMRPAGVNRVNLIQMSYYSPKAGSADKGKGFDNSYMLHMMAMYPDVFVGTAVIDPRGADVAKVMADLGKQRVRAFRIYPGLDRDALPNSAKGEGWLRAAEYDTMFAQGARGNQAISCLINPDALPDLDRMCKKYPSTPVIIDHLCRIGVDGEVREKEVDALCAMAKHQRVMVKIGAFYALGKKKAPYTDLGPLIKTVVSAFGAKRCMWETDCPFQVEDGHTYQASVDLIAKHLNFLTTADREWILTGTAEQFFFAK